MSAMTGMDEPVSTRMARGAFGLLAVVAGVIGAALVAFPSDTASYFAWTIKAPIAAATLGVWFLGLSGFTLAVCRGPVSALRLAAPAVAVGSTLMLITTVLHRVAFNWQSPAAWAWLLVYIAAPPVFTIVSFRIGDRRQTAEATVPLSTPLRGAALTTVGLAGVVGAVLFLWPTLLIPAWPWPLLPLGGRTYAAFVLGHAVWAGRLALAPAERSAPRWYLALFPLMAFIAPWLQPAGFRAGTAGGVTFLALTAGLAILSTVALFADRRCARNP